MVVTEEYSLLPRRLSRRNSRVGFCRFVAGCCVLALISIAAIGSAVEEPYAVQHLDLPSKPHVGVACSNGSHHWRSMVCAKQYGFLQMADTCKPLREGNTRASNSEPGSRPG